MERETLGDNHTSTQRMGRASAVTGSPLWSVDSSLVQ